MEQTQISPLFFCIKNKRNLKRKGEKRERKGEEREREREKRGERRETEGEREGEKVREK